jgi:MraZ protein
MPEAVHLHRMPSFHGETKYGIDDSGRVMIPAKWRPKDASVVFSVILWPIKVETFLLVLPPARWQVMLDKLKTKSLNDARVAAFERVLGVTSAPLTLDKVGRFNIPEHLARRAGIEREVQFVGRLDKFEMWSPARYEAANVQDKILAAEVAAELDL